MILTSKLYQTQRITPWQPLWMSHQPATFSNQTSTPSPYSSIQRYHWLQTTQTWIMMTKNVVLINGCIKNTININGWKIKHCVPKCTYIYQSKPIITIMIFIILCMNEYIEMDGFLGYDGVIQTKYTSKWNCGMQIRHVFHHSFGHAVSFGMCSRWNGNVKTQRQFKVDFPYKTKLTQNHT